MGLLQLREIHLQEEARTTASQVLHQNLYRVHDHRGRRSLVFEELSSFASVDGSVEVGRLTGQFAWPRARYVAEMPLRL